VIAGGLEFFLTHKKASRGPSVRAAFEDTAGKRGTVNTNTKALAKLYDCLTPWERVPLIVSASLRGDGAERGRLMDTAPKSFYRLPDYHGLADGLQRLAAYHVMTQLECAVLFWRAIGLLDQRALLGEDKGPPERRMSRVVGMIAYTIATHADAWKQFWAELNLDPGFLLKGLPGNAIVGEVEEAARDLALTAEEIPAVLREEKGEDAQPVTAASLVKQMREYVQDHLETWS
jgi:hypothetical protein